MALPLKWQNFRTFSEHFQKWSHYKTTLWQQLWQFNFYCHYQILYFSSYLLNWTIKCIKGDGNVYVFIIKDYNDIIHEIINALWSPFLTHEIWLKSSGLKCIIWLHASSQMISSRLCIPTLCSFRLSPISRGSAGSGGSCGRQQSLWWAPNVYNNLRKYDMCRSSWRRERLLPGLWISF